MAWVEGDRQGRAAKFQPIRTGSQIDPGVEGQSERKGCVERSVVRAEATLAWLGTLQPLARARLHS